MARSVCDFQNTLFYEIISIFCFKFRSLEENYENTHLSSLQSFINIFTRVLKDGIQVCNKHKLFFFPHVHQKQRTTISCFVSRLRCLCQYFYFLSHETLAQTATNYGISIRHFSIMCFIKNLSHFSLSKMR